MAIVSAPDTETLQPPVLRWQEADLDLHAQWRSENGSKPPRQVVVADDRTPADRAYRLVCEGTALLWRGDFQNARQMLQSLTRRLDRRRPSPPAATLLQAHHLHRKAQAERARILGLLLIPMEGGHHIPLRRAPDLRQACLEAYGPSDERSVVSLRELLGVVGAHEWRKRGVMIPALGERIHPHHGVFSPVRGEYLDLVAGAPLPTPALADDGCVWDIGVGTGVLSALLLRRGVPRMLGTDLSPKALACAQDNLQRLGLLTRSTLLACNLFPDGQSPLIVCNPPWLPGKASSTVEQAVYDPESRMLRGFLSGLRAHLCPGGEGWLILSDLAERLGLRAPQELVEWIKAAGLRVVQRHDIRPRHGKAHDSSDPLHAARSKEITSLWRLAAD
ncbi:class I SAM-dependent methyltransferase [Aquabacterium lacunae]|uniref:Class I SAM-dependent methyltransferase n=1 Tax=Aquabacterium lacunae TaxID=2528630 RepID=A0A4Q9GWR9_9BURK|nr:class I SAM-dependent methyltransferase [Aquabacterium lacunae]TBO28856.1 class I SAM-dependent methyltransferase [Aquabacterium lacunae]